MKKRDVTLLIILVVLIGLYFLLRQNKPVEKPMPLVSLDSLKIGKIEIVLDTLAIAIQNTDKGWRISSPVDWPVDEDKLKALFKDIIHGDAPSMVVASGEDAIQRYRVNEENAMQIKVYDRKMKLKDHLYLASTEAPFEYLRYSNSSKIYQTRLKVSANFYPDLPYWRDPHILNIDAREIEKIEVKYRFNSYTLSINKGIWTYTDANQSFQIVPENRQMLRMLNILAVLKTYVFLDGDNSQFQEALANPHCSVKVYLSSGKVRLLDFVRGGEEFYLRLDGDNSVLYGVVGDTLDRFTRSAEYFSERYGSPF